MRALGNIFLATLDELQIEFPAKWGNCFVKISHFSRTNFFCRKFKIFAKQFSHFAGNPINAKFCKENENFHYFLKNCCIFCLVFHKIPHHFCFLSQNSFSRKNAKFREKVCEIRKKIFAKFHIFSAKVFFLWKPKFQSRI